LVSHDRPEIFTDVYPAGYEYALDMISISRGKLRNLPVEGGKIRSPSRITACRRGIPRSSDSWITGLETLPLFTFSSISDWSLWYTRGLAMMNIIVAAMVVDEECDPPTIAKIPSKTACSCEIPANSNHKIRNEFNWELDFSVRFENSR